MSEFDITPPIGNKINGNNDVAGIGIASVTHHVAIHKAAATTKTPRLSRLSDLINNSAKTNNSGPKNKPISCAGYMTVYVLAVPAPLLQLFSNLFD